MNGATTSIQPALCHLTLARLAYVTLLLISASAYAAELSEEAKNTGKERRDAAIAQAKQQVADLEKQRTAAAKDRHMSIVASLVGQIKQAKAEVTRASKKTVEDYAHEVDPDRENAKGGRVNPAQNPKPDHDDPDEKAAEPAQIPKLDLAAEQAAAAAEAERLKTSGGCPLQLTSVDFYHADVDSIRQGRRLAGMTSDIPAELTGLCTFVLCKVENCVDEPVEAYELLVQFIDGFDEVIEEQRLQGKLIAPLEKRASKNGWPKVETAVQVRVFLQRTKLADGQLWRREPGHEHVSILVKKPKGADLGQ